MDHKQEATSCLLTLQRVGFGVAIVVLAMVFTIPAVGQEVHHGMCLHGCPAGASASNDLVVRDIYMLSSNDATKFADWVAYRITKGTIGPTTGKRRNWKADPKLSDDETLEPSDYRGANAALNTDRGHQAQLAGLAGSPSWKTTNYLSNITPQKSALNRGAWKMLEKAVRDLATVPGTEAVYVMTGPLYERNMPPLPEADESHRVPSGYWKIVATETAGDIKIAAFVFDQDTDGSADYCAGEFVTKVRTVENRTGLDFFHGLEPVQQDSIENGPATLRRELGCTM